MINDSEDFSNFVDRLMVIEYEILGSLNAKTKMVLAPKMFNNTIPVAP